MLQSYALILLREAVLSHQAENLAQGSLEDRLQKLRNLLRHGVPAIVLVKPALLLQYVYEHGLQESDDELFEATETLDPQR